MEADGLRPDVQSAITPEVSLRSFTNSLLGRTSPAADEEPLYVDTLVWDVVYPLAPQIVHGPVDLDRSKLDPPPCDLHVIVDAMTGAIIEGFQANCSLT